MYLYIYITLVYFARSFLHERVVVPWFPIKRNKNHDLILNQLIFSDFDFKSSIRNFNYFDFKAHLKSKSFYDILTVQVAENVPSDKRDYGALLPLQFFFQGCTIILSSVTERKHHNSETHKIHTKEDLTSRKGRIYLFLYNKT